MIVQTDSPNGRPFLPLSPEPGDKYSRERWAWQPRVSIHDRPSIIAWLAWNDPNGSYDDESAIRDGIEPLTLKAALELFLATLAEGT